ncbi:BBL_G0015440.mRNA.1.CDS.1 [Saccharomyces cerevisiae]|nr:BBL_G0015440.mRNA.1.CDS.1 [Saccharomyces cerevisiae]CAI7103101.1 BBL_G0015440.mRNA.1.CDS.1 [Saccharomyces cerevisiae]
MSIPHSAKQSSPLSSRRRSVTNTTPLLTPRHSRDNSSTQISSAKNITSSSPSTITNESSKRNKQNLVLSTSFISTKRLENSAPSPTSPLMARRTRSTMTKALLNLKAEINNQYQELARLRKKKDDIEHLRDSTISDIYSGSYSTNHLQKHSMRIRANTQLREIDNSIKRVEKHIFDLKQQFDKKRQRSLTTSSSIKADVGSIRNDDGQNNDSEELGDHDSLTDQVTLDDEYLTTPTSGTERNSQQNLNRNSTVNSRNNENHSTLSIPDLDGSNKVNLTGDTEKDLGDLENENQIFTSTTTEAATWLVSDYMQSFQEKNVNPDFIAQKANGLVTLLKEHSEIRKDLVLTSFMSSIQNLLLNGNKLIAASAYRVCRYLINSSIFIDELLELRLDAFIIISLAKDNSFQIEREQALKMVRRFIEYNNGVTQGIMQAIISCVEKPEDSLRHMALETLLELCFVAPEMVKECRGMRVIEGFLQDYTSFSLASVILDTILQLMATHKTRQHFLEDFNVSVLTTVFSDTNTKSNVNVEKMQNASTLISITLNSYNGFMLFSNNNFKPLKQLVSFFQIPICAQYLIDIFLDVLKIKPLPYKPRGRHSHSFKPIPSQYYKECMSVNQRLALIVLILENSEFVPHLLELLNEEDRDDHLVAKGRYLLTEYFNLRMNLVDKKYTSVSKPIYKENFTYVNETFQFKKIAYKMNRNRNTIGMSGIDYAQNIKSFSKNIKENTLLREVDDFRFRRMVYDSKVLQTKDFTRWNWNIINELLEGPLLNKKQLEELVKSTKFIRRLLVFYRPLRLRFSNVNKGAKLSQKYVQVGCQFFKTLTATPEGMKILMDDTKIIPQLASLMFRAMEGNISGNIFNKNKLREKIIFGYFKFIGILTQSKNGVHILTRWNFFTVIYKMFQFESKLGLEFLLLTIPELDLKYSSHCRVIIGKALVVANEKVRIEATKHIGDKLKELLSTKESDLKLKANKVKLQQFKMEMLTRQLYDLSPSVVAVADQALYECIVAGNGSEELGTSFRMFLNQMVFIRSPILFELLSRPYGFQLLNEINFVKEERDSWLSKKNIEYVHIVEEFLKKNESINAKSLTFQQKSRLPLHFYESLTKTEDGILLLSQTGDLVTFMNVIKKYVNGNNMATVENAKEILDLKAALWCVGFIGSTELGIGLLDNYSLVEDIIEVAYNASVTSVRFTAFYVLGLIGMTREGCEILDEMGWNCCVSVQDEPIGIALPNRLDRFLSYNEHKWSAFGEYSDEMIVFNKSDGDLIEKCLPIEFDLDKLLKEKDTAENPLNEKIITNKYDNDITSQTITVSGENSSLFANEGLSSPYVTQYRNDDDSIESKVLHIVSQLGNHILSNHAVKEITEINNKYGPRLFENEKMFFKVFNMMSKYRFKPHVRKFLCGLFINNRALENVIRHDNKRDKRPANFTR